MSWDNRPLYRGGRKKGTKNKKTDLFAKCEKLNVDVFEEMLRIAMDTPEDKQQSRFNRFAKCAEYLYARPKDQGDINLTPEQIREMIKEWTKDAEPNEGIA